MEEYIAGFITMSIMIIFWKLIGLKEQNTTIIELLKEREK